MALLTSLVAGAGAVGFAESALAYNGPGAASYADTWALSYNPHYLRFSDDCTNFVSQALHAGGLAYKGYQKNPGSNANWWQDAANNDWSKSWTVASELRQHLQAYGHGTFEGSAPGTSTKPYTPNSVKTGDVYFFDFGQGWGYSHSVIQVGIGTASDTGQYGNYIDEHSSNRKHVFWTLQKWNSFAKTTTIYFTHVYGN